MPFLYTVLLLAASSTLVFAGPLPRENRRQLFQSYANTTQISASLSQHISASHSVASPSQGQLVNADTAIVIEPVQRTVITHVIPAVTFLNPKGEPIATQTAETVLSTSYFTPAPQPAPSPSAPATPSPPSSSTSSTLLVSSSTSKVMTPISSPVLAAPMSSQAAVESGPMNQTSRPAFTYSPEESQSASLVISSAISSTPVATSKPSTGNSTTPSGLPAFDHPGSAPSGALPQLSSLSSALVSSTRSPSPITQSTIAPVVTGSASNSPVVVTKTEYTTVLPSPTALTPVGGSELITGTTPVQASQPVLPSSKTSPATLSPTPLEPPPVVVITEYTTVAPAPTGGGPTPSTSPSVPEPVPSPPSPPVAPAPSSPVAAPPQSSPLSASRPTSSTPVPGPPAQSSSPAASSIPAQVSSSPKASPQPPSPSPSSPVASSSTTEGPLIITPIAPSQVFTVTVTATEKETVTETATVSVTVTA